MEGTLQQLLTKIGVSLSADALLVVVGLCCILLGAWLGRWSQQRKNRALINEYEKSALEKKIEDQRFFDDQLDRIHHVFGDLAQRALTNNSQQFAELAQAQFKHLTQSATHEFKLNSQGIESLVKPIRDALKATDDELRKLAEQRQISEAKLSEQIRQIMLGHQELSTETRNLVSALRRPEVRGQWGEITLKRMVELAGMSRYCDFELQPTVKDELVSIRPDMVVHLPLERQLIIDVKTPLDAYLSALEASAPEQQEIQLQRHAQNVRQRVKELSQKKYWEMFASAADFVVLFIPGEQFLSAALDQDSQLLDYALDRNILLAGPTGLIGLLKTIAHGWQSYTLNQNTQEIRVAGETLLKRLNTLEDHLLKLGRHLDQSVEQFQKLSGSFNRSAKPAARRLSELGLGALQERSADEANDEQPKQE